MKNKLFIVIIIIAIIVGVYFKFIKPSIQTPSVQDVVSVENSPEPMPTNIEEHTDEESLKLNEKPVSENIITVNYTDNGFNPSVVEIKKGETVQFINQSAGGMWIGSGPHPTHTAYPEFDAKKNIPNGGIYKFTFNKAGSWSYHNHIGPGKTGMIIVK